MKLFKTTEWKWWELKFMSWGGVLLGFALGAYFGSYLMDWLWLVWIVFAILWIYIIIEYFKK